MPIKYKQRFHYYHMLFIHATQDEQQYSDCGDLYYKQRFLLLMHFSAEMIYIYKHIIIKVPQIQIYRYRGTLLLSSTRCSDVKVIFGIVLYILGIAFVFFASYGLHIILLIQFDFHENRINEFKFSKCFNAKFL